MGFLSARAAQGLCKRLGLRMDGAVRRAGSRAVEQHRGVLVPEARVVGVGRVVGKHAIERLGDADAAWLAGALAPMGRSRLPDGPWKIS